VSANHQTASANHQTASANHQTASVNHQTASANHQTASVNHQTVSVNHQTVRVNHQTAGVDTDPTDADGAAAVGGGAEGDVLSVEDVTVDLGGRRVLDRVRFVLGEGEFTGLIGSNGAGKTTLFRVILGLQELSAGQVRLGGRARNRRNPSIGYVPQKINLDPDMPLRARDLVGLGLDGHRLGIPLPSRRRRDLVDEMLAAVDGTRFADARVGTLSGGEQQRVMIAHALISRPRLLLLDEPLANLDIGSGREVVTLLARIAAEQRIAVLISAHDMNPLLPVMDRIVYLAEGRAASGTTDEVVRSDTLTALYGSPVEVLRVHGRILVVADLEAPAVP
jgi:zinc/manganese transport system ATP-binding protein